MKLVVDFSITDNMGYEVREMNLTIEPFYDDEQYDFNKKKKALERLCVEYARLQNEKCSFAEIHSIELIKDKKPRNDNTPEKRGIK